MTQAAISIVLVIAPAAISDGAGFAWGAAGALVATIINAGIQAWRGKSQAELEKANAEKLKAEAGTFIDERWERLSRTLAARVDELEAEVAECYREIEELRRQLRRATA